MARSILLFFSFLVFFSSSINAQEIWSLEKCVDHARQENLTLKQMQIGVQHAKLTEKQHQFSRLPQLNGSISAGLQFGRTIDPTTNSFDNQTIGFNQFGLNAGMSLYNGNRINNSIKKSKLDLKAAEADSDAAFNDLALNLAAAYLQTLFAEEQLENARRRTEQTREQLDQTDKLIEAGVLPKNDRLNLLAQLALEEQGQIQAQNTVDVSYLAVKHLLDLEPDFELKLERPEVLLPDDAALAEWTLPSVYEKAMHTQPQIAAGEIRLKSAAVDEKIAQAGMLPSVILFGGVNTNYSTLAQEITGFDSSIQDQEVIFNGTTATVGFPVDVPRFQDRPYFDQISDNFGQNVGMQISIPVYNNHQHKVAVERAQLNRLSTELTNKQTRQQLKTSVQSAIADARAAQLNLDAAQKSFDAAQMAFTNSRKKFDLGAINTFDLTTAKTTMDNAQADLSLARYDYLFKLKVVDFYLGNKITLK